MGVRVTRSTRRCTSGVGDIVAACGRTAGSAKICVTETGGFVTSFGDRLIEVPRKVNGAIPAPGREPVPAILPVVVPSTASSTSFPTPADVLPPFASPDDSCFPSPWDALTEFLELPTIARMARRRSALRSWCDSAADLVASPEDFGVDVDEVEFSGE